MKSINQRKKDIKQLRLVIKGVCCPYTAFYLGQKYPFDSRVWFAADYAESFCRKFPLQLRLKRYRETGFIMPTKNFV